MKRLLRQLIKMAVGIATVTALIGAASGLEPLGTPAEAATTYVSKRYTAPRKGQTSSGVRALQLRLVKASVLSSAYVTSYFGPITEGAVRRFQRRHGLRASGKVNRTTWSLLVKQTGTMKLNVRKVSSRRIDARCKIRGRALCIDKTRDKLYYMRNSRVIRTMDARFGCASSRTREGRFQVNWKSRNHYSTLYYTAMPYAMFFSGGQAVHYSADFAARGYRGCSHGCVNIRDRAGIRWVFDRVRVGDRVVVYRS